MIALSSDDTTAIERIVRERFGNKVETVEIDLSTDETGDDIIMIRVFMAKDVTAEDFSGRFFGLTGRVRDALQGDLRGVFPVIRPLESHA